jgi:hypothetical protein
MQFVRVLSCKNVEAQLTAEHFTHMSFRILINNIVILAEKLV